MKNKTTFKAAFVIAILALWLLPHVNAAAGADNPLPEFKDFVASVTDGHAEMIRGVYVPGVLAIKVLQQPENNPAAVMEEEGAATQFRAAAANNVIGLLAHNNLAGSNFSSLRIGQEVRIVYGDGRVEYFVVNLIARFKANKPADPHSTFEDWKTGITYSTQSIFDMFYKGSYHVTFQTCILADGEPSWGRLFVTATPVTAAYFHQEAVPSIVRRPMY